MNGDEGTASCPDICRCAAAMARAPAAVPPPLECTAGPTKGVLLVLRLLARHNSGDLAGHIIGDASSSEMDAHRRRAGPAP
mmetsp:Transcript_80736/g.180646  ORF Transcript_80736/g.180646 Transcript_80736/m.180646 type:complete len:81 (+) Transcript_80736:1436-1678(+)